MKNKRLAVFLGVIFVLSVISSGCEKKHADSQDKTDQVEDIQKNQVEQNTTADNQQTTKSIKIYYINDETGTLQTKGTEILDEKDIWRQLQNTGIITEDCQLLEFSLNESEKKIDLDFNKATGDRIRSMGTTGESEILACIINTYLDAYECDGIKLTEEGEPLETNSGGDFNGYSSRIEL